MAHSPGTVRLQHAGPVPVDDVQRDVPLDTFQYGERVAALCPRVRRRIREMLRARKPASWLVSHRWPGNRRVARQSAGQGGQVRHAAVHAIHAT